MKKPSHKKEHAPHVALKIPNRMKGLVEFSIGLAAALVFGLLFAIVFRDQISQFVINFTGP